MRAVISVEEVYRVLDTVLDPEVPVVSVVELGIVRDVAVADGRVTITVTPTYSGCPAMHVIEHDMRAALEAVGVADVTIETVYAPAWTTDWIGADAREKMRRFGIAPPGQADALGVIELVRLQRAVPCPYCGSGNTVLKSRFGSTACKAIHYCNACRQPFDEFKAF